ncbi:cryptochrome/photolyase family protein [Flavobacterium sp. TP390]|uniref:Cryptochrome/photolyase family protein n=1 Tax=Flavobacterium profundi TaxID=1774945 RepID=A0A6I4IL95_9FLAO|nr:cryptochrome/photolyase family protein [Flavobacterium profundi]MVO09101.1 cryptochrome/photolyase family protein [Flavobacterium profundi]
MKKLRLILGDQLNAKHSWYKEKDTNTIYLMAEMRQETDYVKHHIQKVVAFFLSMRNFAEAIEKAGHQIVYFTISDPKNLQNLEKIIAQVIEEKQIEKFEYQLPDEFRLDQQLKEICSNLKITSEVFDTEHFYTTRTELANFFEGKKSLLMENFYRMMRKKHQILVINDQPLGGKWNYDHKNRNKYNEEITIPKPFLYHKDVTKLVEEIEKAGVKTFGSIDLTNFPWPTNRKESLALLTYFCENLLEHFGAFQDALYSNDSFLFHSRLSFAMNSKMISPKEVIETVVSYYEKNKSTIDIAQIEGFVRQIIGWREYVRGIYWKEMPKYATLNTLENYNKLPDFYWTGKTKMKCMQHSLHQSLNEAYAHHIQRLMVIGNFSLLTQLNPDAVDAWYLGVYIDAIEWVELPNTRGMSQYADGGILATKPYVSSGSYIHKMSNYCKNCHYKVKDKLGNKACPFNSLYWNFLDDKKEFFKNNQRMGMMLALLKKIKPEELSKIKEKAQDIIENPDSY